MIAESQYYQDSHGSRRRVHPKRKHVTSTNKLRGPRAGRIRNQRLIAHTIDCNTCLNADNGDFCDVYFELGRELIAAAKVGA